MNWLEDVANIQLQEQPLLLEDLVEQERREQMRQQQGGSEMPVPTGPSPSFRHMPGQAGAPASPRPPLPSPHHQHPPPMPSGGPAPMMHPRTPTSHQMGLSVFWSDKECSDQCRY